MTPHQLIYVLDLPNGYRRYREPLVDRGNGLLCPACTAREFRRLLGVEKLYAALVAKLEAAP